MGQYIRYNWRKLVVALVIVLLLGGLLIFRLGSLTGGLSAHEQATASTPIGWHGLYRQPFYLPLQVVRSAVFFVSPTHGQTLTRLANVVFGLLAIGLISWLIYHWHGSRTAYLATILFATSAWVLHVSRLASYEVMYLIAVPALLASYLLLQQYKQYASSYVIAILIWGNLLYVPGMVWLVGLTVLWQARQLTQLRPLLSQWWQRLLVVLAGIWWIPLLAHHLLTTSGAWRSWLGLPAHFAAPLSFLKHLAVVPLHLFVHGPPLAEMWLGRAPLLDVFSLAMCFLGIAFYVRHLRAGRSRYLLTVFALGIVLIGLEGPVGLSLLVPLLYIWAATGLAYFLREWFRVFPLNPLARGLGIALVTLAVLLSGLYNLRAYFIAWPHNPDTTAIFRYHR